MIIDKTVLEKLASAIGVENVRLLIDVYRTDTSKLVAELAVSYAKDDQVTLERTAHSLKSSSALLGFCDVSETAALLESLSKFYPNEEIGNEIEKLKFQFSQLETTLLNKPPFP